MVSSSLLHDAAVSLTQEDGEVLSERHDEYTCSISLKFDREVKDLGLQVRLDDTVYQAP